MYTLANANPTIWIVIAIVALVLFGGAKIPEMMKGLGQGMGAFKKGLFFVQDPAATLVTEYAAIPMGSTVADLCAAPGGKALELSRTAAHRTRARFIRDLSAHAPSLAPPAERHADQADAAAEQRRAPRCVGQESPAEQDRDHCDVSDAAYTFPIGSLK